VLHRKLLSHWNSSAFMTITLSVNQWRRQAWAWGLTPHTKRRLAPHRETDWSRTRVSVYPTVSNFDRFCTTMCAKCIIFCFAKIFLNLTGRHEEAAETQKNLPGPGWGNFWRSPASSRELAAVPTIRVVSSEISGNLF